LLFIQSLTLFFVVGGVASFSLSGAQAVSRTLVPQLSPASQTTDFYGFTTVAGRTSTFIGPLVFGTISFRAHNWYVNHGFESLQAEQLGMRAAIISIIVFLVIGLLILLSVKQNKEKAKVPEAQA
jgi:UMF1 family MFS transporter